MKVLHRTLYKKKISGNGSQFVLEYHNTLEIHQLLSEPRNERLPSKLTMQKVLDKFLSNSMFQATSQLERRVCTSVAT